MARITGNASILVGTDLADLLTGFEFSDPTRQVLMGLQGDDTYLLHALNSVVLEDAGPGTGVDTIRLAVGLFVSHGVGDETVFYTMPFQVENLDTEAVSGLGFSSKSLSVLGNDLANRIGGTVASDSIDGGRGADRMAGLGGSDTYFVDNAGDVAEEAVDGGIDLVNATVTYTLPANVEDLRLENAFGDPRIDGTGNALGNDVFGNHADNALRGLAGDDLLVGGFGADSLDGGDGADVLDGNDGLDVLLGGAGDDILDGGAGADTLAGGAGGDTYVDVDASDVLTEVPGGGYDRVDALVDWTLAANFEQLVLVMDGGAVRGTGNALGNAIDGNQLDNRLIGLEGNDRLDGKQGADTMVGGVGNDTFVIDDAGDQTLERAGEGIDWVLAAMSPDFLGYRLAPNVENLLITRSAEVSFPTYYFIYGNELDNRIIGSSGFEIIIGGAGNDLLDGGGSGDSLQGGTGNDTYIMYDGSTGIIELANAGDSDTVLSWVGISKLANNVENATLLTSNGALLRANNLDNRLEGGGGSDFIDGLDGNDTFSGGAGDDSYVVTGLVADKVIEATNGGTDTIYSFMDRYELPTNVEALYLGGPNVGVRGFGNALDNFIQGNAIANELRGGAGNDTLNGLGGNDSLDGGAGNDLLDGGSGPLDDMKGGAGNDTYIVGSDTDIVRESVADGGIDEVRASASFTLGALAAGVENLLLLDGAINGTGNARSNIITGNIANNTLDGGAGDDTLDGGGGIDTLIGGTGNDVYVVGNVGDTVTETIAGGSDSVRSFVNFTLGDNIENLILLGNADLEGNGNALPNQITGNGGDNLLRSGLGNDTLTGGKGDDQYVLENANDKVTELKDEGVDIIYLSLASVPAAGLNYKLPDNVEGLDIHDGDFVVNTNLRINVDGNALGNFIVGSGAGNIIKGFDGNDYLEGAFGADTIDGGAGDDLFGGEEVTDTAGDSLTGGLGNDLYHLDNDNDVVVELAGQGTDTVIVSGNIIVYNAAVKAAAVENFILNDTNDFDGNFVSPLNIAFTGNALDNDIRGNHGDSSVDAAGGNDTIRFTAYDIDLTPWATLKPLLLAGPSIRRSGITLDQNDTVNGGGGNDTLFAEVVDQSAPLHITNVERINLYAGTAAAGSNSVATGGFTQLQKITVSDSVENTAADITLSGLATNVTVSAVDFHHQLTLALANAAGASDSVDVVLRNVDMNLVTAGIERVNLDVGDFSPRQDFGPMRIDMSDATGLQTVELTGRDSISLNLPDIGGTGPELILKDLNADLRLVSDLVAPTLTDLTVHVSNVNMAMYSGDFAFGANQHGPSLTTLTIDTTPEGGGTPAGGSVTNTMYLGSLGVADISVQGTAELELHIAGQRVDASALQAQLYLFADAGGGGVDVTGGQNFDRIQGSNFDDRLNAGVGGGDVNGFGGSDTFVFDSAVSSGITYIGFGSGEDTIELHASQFAGLTTDAGRLDASNFFVGDPGDVQTTNQKIIFDQVGQGLLYYDADGSGTASSAVAFASVWFNANVTAADIAVV